MLEPGSFPTRHHGPRSLMSRPQRLGFLPTLWFWEEVRFAHPLTNMLIGLAMGLFGVFTGSLLLDLLGLPGLLVVPFLPFLFLGLIERGFRWFVIRRRKQLAAKVRDELTSGDP